MLWSSRIALFLILPEKTSMLSLKRDKYKCDSYKYSVHLYKLVAHFGCEFSFLETVTRVTDSD